MKIVCDDKIPFLKGAFEPFAEVVYLPGAKISRADVRDADAIVTRTRTRCDASLLEGSCTRAIASATIGFDHIDTRWCEENGIKWSNAPGCNSSSVAQYLGSVLVTLARKHELELGKLTLGVVGVGHVGSKVAAIGEALGMEVLLCDPPRAEAEGPEGFVSLDEIVRSADIISLHVPLQADTYHLFDAARIGSMRPDQILVNTSRGEVVDGDALKAALGERRLRGAVLDVWEHENEIDRALMRLLDVSTAHIAGYSADGKAAGTRAAVRFLASELGIDELRDWSVGVLPAPVQPLEFTLEAAGKSMDEVLAEAILYTYDVLWDSGRLRSHTSEFETLRSEYQIRREFGSYTLLLRDGTDEEASRLRKLGFKVIEI